MTAATAVNAQDVQVYGIIDTGFQQHNNGTDTYTRAQNSALTASRLGFRGTEDLGDGLKANFQIEGTVNPSTGSMGSTTVVSNEVFNREAWVGISGGFGEVRVGRQDLTYAQDIDAGVSQFNNFGLMPINGVAVETGTDQRNVVRYITPTVGGFYAQAGFASGNNAGATSDAEGDQKGLMVGYTDGRLRIFAGRHETEATATAGDRDFTVIATSYDFGVLSAGLVHANGDVNNTNGSKNKTLQASVKVPLSNGLALHGIYAVAKDGAQTSGAEGRGYTMGVTKSLSKRTVLYAAYNTVDNDTNAKMYMSGQVAAPATAGLDTRTTTVGISHTF